MGPSKLTKNSRRRCLSPDHGGRWVCGRRDYGYYDSYQQFNRLIVGRSMNTYSVQVALSLSGRQGGVRRAYLQCSHLFLGPCDT